jgi:hypothetical protein
MAKYFYLLTCVICVSCMNHDSIIRDNVIIVVQPNEAESTIKSYAMPEINPQSNLIAYKRRFDYLLINISEIHLPEKAEERNRIFNLYPDTLQLKQRYLDKYVQDKKLAEYFEESFTPIDNPDFKRNKTYSSDELMEVASKFFYCDKVEADTTIQTHICIGLNGVKEANWEKDYTLLEAFCYEAIFHDFEDENSEIHHSFVANKKESCEIYRKNITSLDRYLQDVKLNLFERMKNDKTTKKKLLEYYQFNKQNLSFVIMN